MKEQIIVFETAKLVKEKGFNWKTRNLFSNEVLHSNHTFQDYNYTYKSKEDRVIYSAPTQSLLQKWLREEHDIDVNSYPYIKDVWRFSISFINFKYKTIDGRHPEFKVQLSRDWSKDAMKYKTYEQALEVGLQEALTSIK